MARALKENLRSGAWLTPERARGYSLILLAFYLIAAVAWIVLSDGLVDRNGKPLGTDFSNVYAAGSLTLEGRPADAYDPARQHAAVAGERRLLGLAVWEADPVVHHAQLGVEGGPAAGSHTRSERPPQ